MKSNVDPINLDWFKLITEFRKRATVFEFYNGDKWVPLIKRIGEFLAPKTLKGRWFGVTGVNAMEGSLCIDETPFALKRSFKAATKRRCELPTDIEKESIPFMKHLSLAEDGYNKRWESLQNAELERQKFLGIHKVL